MKRLSIIAFLLFVCACANSETFAQRKSVSGAEVTGTFRSYLTGRFNDSYNEILIQALGGNKLKIEMKLVHPYQVTENISVNVGHATGEAVIEGDTAVFTPEDAISELCKITLKFSEPGTLIVSTKENRECAFGQFVSGDGTYKKTSGTRPKFGVDTSSGYVEPQERKAVTGNHLAVFTGKCRFQLIKGFFPCDSKVVFAQLANGRSLLTFIKREKGKEIMFTLSGGSDRQPNLENYFLGIDTFRLKNGDDDEVSDNGMEGECHFRMNKAATNFFSVKCDIYNRAKGTIYNFYLENITKTDHQEL